MSDYKDYLYDIVPKKAVEKKELTRELTDDQAFQLVVALVAAEEGANIISDELRRTAMMQGGIVPLVQPIAGPERAPQQVIVPPVKNRVTKMIQFDNLGVDGSKQVASLIGVGTVHEIYISAVENTFGISIFVDGDFLYENDYADLAIHSVADSHLAVYKDTDSDEYYIVVNDLRFTTSMEAFVTNTASGQKTFTIVRLNYEIEV